MSNLCRFCFFISCKTGIYKQTSCFKQNNELLKKYRFFFQNKF